MQVVFPPQVPSVAAERTVQCRWLPSWSLGRLPLASTVKENQMTHRWPGKEPDVKDPRECLSSMGKSHIVTIMSDVCMAVQSSSISTVAGCCASLEPRPPGALCPPRACSDDSSLVGAEEETV